MTISEYVTAIVSVGNPAALAFVILRYGPCAVLRLLAGIAAIVTKDDKRAQRCLEVLRLLRARERSLS
jgi:hypothetical protein